MSVRAVAGVNDARREQAVVTGRTVEGASLSSVGLVERLHLERRSEKSSEVGPVTLSGVQAGRYDSHQRS